jgi:hypothetical protein
MKSRMFPNLFSNKQSSNNVISNMYRNYVLGRIQELVKVFASEKQRPFLTLASVLSSD